MPEPALPLVPGCYQGRLGGQRSKDILNAPYYFHVVFTVPQQLYPLIYQNQALIR